MNWQPEIVNNMLKSIFVLAICGIFVQAQDSAGITDNTPKVINPKSVLVPNYDNKEHKLKVFDERENIPLILACNITINGNYKLAWTRNGNDVAQDSELNGRYTIHEKENKFVIQKPKINDAGVYACSVPELKDSQDINVVANVYLKGLPENSAVVEGEKLVVHCVAYGTAPEIRWHLGNETYTESIDRITFKEDDDGVKNAILIIAEATLDDQRFVNCTATNMATKYVGQRDAETFTYVRVKGKLAALWPFIGICTEVFILCAIILVYEKKRHRSAIDDSDDEQDKLKQVKK